MSNFVWVVAIAVVGSAVWYIFKRPGQSPTSTDGLRSWYWRIVPFKDIKKSEALIQQAADALAEHSVQSFANDSAFTIGEQTLRVTIEEPFFRVLASSEERAALEAKINSKLPLACGQFHNTKPPATVIGEFALEITRGSEMSVLVLSPEGKAPEPIPHYPPQSMETLAPDSSRIDQQRLLVTVLLGGEIWDEKTICGRSKVGRGAGCEIILPDVEPGVSRTHLTLTPINGRVQVEDTSSFGTFVLGQRRLFPDDDEEMSLPLEMFFSPQRRTLVRVSHAPGLPSADSFARESRTLRDT